MHNDDRHAAARNYIGHTAVAPKAGYVVYHRRPACKGSLGNGGLASIYRYRYIYRTGGPLYNRDYAAQFLVYPDGEERGLVDLGGTWRAAAKVEAE